MRWGALVVLTCGSLSSSSLWAAEVPAINLTGLEPPMAPDATMSLESTATPGHGNFGAGTWATYAYRLVRIEDTSGHQLGAPIRHQVASYLLFNWGLGDRFALGLALPYVAYQQGDSIRNLGWHAPQTALGDPIIELKRNLIQKSTLGGAGLSAYARASLPLGSDESAIGERHLTGQLGLRGEIDLVLLALRTQVGYAMRPQNQDWLGEKYGSFVPWALGFTFKPQALGWDKKGAWNWFIEGHGRVSVTPEFGAKHSSPAMLSLGSRYALGSDLSLLGSVTLPLDSAIGVPALRATLGLSWAPRFLDADQDGIADDADDCPEGLPEDRDGFQDDDGCPDDDNDGDGVPDAFDRCPASLEDQDGYQDQDGCPDPDNDGDGITDTDDACPNVKGAPSKSKKHNGCIVGDSDKDTIADDVDRCPDRPEDLDGRYDQDGCPDPDDDADGILDQDDDCPTVRGHSSSVKGLNGCPDPDPDGDTYFGTVGDRFTASNLLSLDKRQVGMSRDLCPDEAEDFDGDSDDDGCFDPQAADKKNHPLVALQLSGSEGTVKFARPVQWSRENPVMLVSTDEVLLMALAKELRIHRDWSAQVTVHASSTQAADVELAQKRAAMIVEQIKRLTLRDNSSVAMEPLQSTRPHTAGQSLLEITLRSPMKRNPTKDEPKTAPAPVTPSPSMPATIGHPTKAQPAPPPPTP